MIRSLDRLTSRTFDVLVVGGGIIGLAIAYDAAQRGLAVALIERDDFGSGSSFNHLRTLHGGLRYLQRLDIRRARESVRERATLARIAPHAVRPLPFALPLYRSIRSGKSAVRAGFALDRLVAFGRNAGVSESLQTPCGHVMSRAEAEQLFRGLARPSLTGAALWYDYITLESDRLTFAFGLAADEHGAVLANHVEAMAPLVDGRRVVGVKARDRQSGRDLEIGARLTVNATGAATDRLLQPLGISTGWPLLKAMNLVTNRPAGDAALGGRSPAGRNLFLLPWRGRLLVGTWESSHAAGAEALSVSRVEIESFLAEVNQAFPVLDLTIADVTLVHRGIVPAVRTPGGGVRLEGRERVRDHSIDSLEGLVSVAGTKYTTARAVAERIVDHAQTKLGRSPVECRTAATLLPGGTAQEPAACLAEARREYGDRLPSDTIPHLVAAYGSRYRDVVTLTNAQETWRSRVADDSPVIGGELVWAVRKEMAVTLCDAVIRRTPLGALAYPGDAATTRAAAIVGSELGWPEERQRQEIAVVKQFYEIA